jgi:hypothetical protein
MGFVAYKMHAALDKIVWVTADWTSDSLMVNIVMNGHVK